MFSFFNKILFLVIFFVGANIFPQEMKFYNKLDSSKRQNITQSIFDEIESGISAGQASSLAPYLSGQTYLSFSNGVNGYYSTNQAYYILEDFFNIYRVVSFKFQNVKSDENIPYATGTYHFDNKGKRGMARVFISLTRSKNNWKISQLTIN